MTRKLSHRSSALEARVPVLGEWPLAVGLREAEELQCAVGDVPTFVGLQGRSSPTFRWLRDLVSQGYVGDVLSATVVASSSEWGNPVPERGVYILDRRLGATMMTVAFAPGAVGDPPDLAHGQAPRHTCLL